MLIAQLTDLHIRPKGVAAYRVAETNMLTERAFRAVAALRPAPDIVVISGDLTDCGLLSEYELLRELLARLLPMPVFVIPGNHDRRENLRAVLKDLPGVVSDPCFVQYAVDDYPVRLIMLDTIVPGAGHGELCAERLAFLDRTLGQAADKPTMIVMHHPPFVCGIGHMDQINLRNAGAFAEVIGRHTQVQRIVCGHHHRPVFARLRQANRVHRALCRPPGRDDAGPRRARVLRHGAGRLPAPSLERGGRHGFAHGAGRAIPWPLSVSGRPGLPRCKPEPVPAGARPIQLTRDRDEGLMSCLRSSLTILTSDEGTSVLLR